MDRETKTIKTPIGGNKVELIAYLTGRDKIQIASSKEEILSVVMLEIAVISVDGEKENPSEKVLDMHGKDYDFVVEEARKIVMDSSWEPEKKS